MPPLIPLQFSDFAPDLDPITPGACQDMGGMMPSEKGFRTLPGLELVATLPSTCYGAISTNIVINQTAPNVLAACTVNGIYLLSSSGTFIPQVTGLANTGNRWRFAEYGQLLILVNGVDGPYYYDGSSLIKRFILLNAPLASLTCATDYAVILVAPDSQTLYSNFSPTSSWTDSVPAQVYTYDLLTLPGSITSVQRKRSLLAVYRQNALQCATFVGGSIGWDFGQPGTISDTVGAAGNQCVVNIGDIDYIWGPDDFYTFDGYSLNPIPNHLKEWVFRDLNQKYAANVAGRYDLQRDLVFWHYPSRNTARGLAGGLDSYVVLYRRTGKWGFGRLDIEIPLTNSMPDPDLSSTATTPDSGIFLPNNHGLYIYDDDVAITPVGNVFITSNDFGDRQSVYQCRRVMPGFTQYPVPGATGQPPATIKALVQMKAGTTPTAFGQSVPISDDGWFNIMTTGRLTRFKIEIFGTAEITSSGQCDFNVTGEV